MYLFELEIHHDSRRPVVREQHWQSGRASGSNRVSDSILPKTGILAQPCGDFRPNGRLIFLFGNWRRALVITPNLPEAEVLVGGPIRTLDEMREAARRLRALGPNWVVIKGGHGGDDTVTDLLYDGQTFDRLDRARIDTPHTHGTGCTFSAAMTACLARGKTVPEAFAAAKQYTHAAIIAAPGLGHGHGPLNHLVSPWDEPNCVKTAEDAGGLFHD